MTVFEGQYLQENSHNQETVYVYDTRKKIIMALMAFEVKPRDKSLK